MEEKDLIAYKQWLESLGEPAPSDAWEAVADQLDIDDAWQGISSQLDVDAVWTNIEKELPAQTGNYTSVKNKQTLLYWVAAAMLLLIMTTPIPESVEYKSQPNVSEGTALFDNNFSTPEKQNTKQESQRLIPDMPNAIAKSNVLMVTVDVNDQVVTENSVAALLTKQLIEYPLENSIMEQIEPFENSEVEKESKKQIKSDSLNRIASLPVTDSLKKQTRTKWCLGALVAVNNTWLINDETLNGLKPTTLGNTQFTFAQEFAVLAERSISTRSSLQAEFYFYSEVAQRYQEYINALYQTKDIKLNYLKFQLLYRHQLFSVRSLPVHFLGGLYISKLRNAHTVIGRDDQLVTQNYAPWNYGVVTGVDTEFKLTSKLVMSPGLRISYGVRNIFAGTQEIPSEFNNTHTASFGFSLAVKQRIK